MRFIGAEELSKKCIFSGGAPKAAQFDSRSRWKAFFLPWARRKTGRTGGRTERRTCANSLTHAPVRTTAADELDESVGIRRARRPTITRLRFALQSAGLMLVHAHNRWPLNRCASPKGIASTGSNQSAQSFSASSSETTPPTPGAPALPAADTSEAMPRFVYLPIYLFSYISTYYLVV